MRRLPGQATRTRHTRHDAVFELFGNRAIDHDGWWAATRHGLDERAVGRERVPRSTDSHSLPQP